MNRDKAFQKTKDSAKSEFDRQLSRLISESKDSEESVQIIYVDKNHPKSGIPITNKIINAAIPLGVELRRYYVIPKIKNKL